MLVVGSPSNISTTSTLVEDSSCDECGCCTEFGLYNCAVKTIPVRTLDLEDIFRSARNRFGDSTYAEEWEALKPTHKRWCLYWWFAVNIYELHSENRPLPHCLIENIRIMFPNETGVEYTGFKRKCERANRKRRVKTER